MLAFYTTDAAVSPALLEKALKTVVPGTYNQMSVDLDTSTNDTLIIMASGLAGNPEICEENADYAAFVAALTAIAEHMCAEHAGDGEGATHLITCEVDGDEIIFIIARELLKKGKLNKKKVVCTVLSNMGVERNLNSMGVSMLRVDVGDHNVQAAMAKGGYVLGGEQ